MKQIIFFSISLLMSVTSFASYPNRITFMCKMYGEDLDQVTAKATMSVKEIFYTEQPSYYLKVQYSSAWDKIIDTEHSIPATKVSKVGDLNRTLRLSAQHTPKEHRFTRWDDAYLIMNLKKQASVKVDGIIYTGYKAAVGYNTSLRYHEVDAICVRQ